MGFGNCGSSPVCFLPLCPTQGALDLSYGLPLYPGHNPGIPVPGEPDATGPVEFPCSSPGPRAAESRSEEQGKKIDAAGLLRPVIEFS